MSRGFLQALAGTSVSGGVVILTVLILRAFFQDKTPRRVWCLLWDVTLARLLILGEISSPVSIWTWFPALTQAPETGGKTVAPSEMMSLSGFYSGGLPRETVISSDVPAWDAGTALTLIWLAVALLLAGTFLWHHLRSIRIYASSLPGEDTYVRNWVKRHTLRRRVQVRTSDHVAAPLTYGIVHPVILLPAGTEALPCVLEHELTHIRRFDTLRKGLLAAALCIHWFHPLVWVFYFLANRDMELCCDEAVLRSGEDREAYALALLELEEQRGRWRLSGSHFSQNALEERVKAIMKQKHFSVAALLTVLAIMGGTVTVFASAAPENKKNPPESGYVYNHCQAVENDIMILSDGVTGERQYSDDGGKHWMNETQYRAQYGSDADWQVEWWTAEDYALWLEEEKQNLQSIIGEKGYTSTDGWFTWDQERVDEAIALYERILEEIQNGALYSKTITDKQGNVMEDTSLASGGALDLFTATTFSEEEVDSWNEAELLERLGAYGVKESKSGELTYYGQTIRALVDGVPVGESGYSIRYVYTNDNGTVDIHTLRSRVYHNDGSFDPMGALIGVAAQGDAEFDQAFIDCVWNGKTAQATTDVVEEASYDEGIQSLEKYVPFGLSYEYDENGLSMKWKGKAVHSIYDTETETWYANNLYGSDLGDGAVDLETVYRNGELSGLKTVPSAQTITLPFTIDGDGGDGQTLEEIFAQYQSYGLEYTPRDGNHGILIWNGTRVKTFLDRKPDGSVFCYSDPDLTEGLTVQVAYGQDGKRTDLYVK